MVESSKVKQTKSPDLGENERFTAMLNYDPDNETSINFGNDRMTRMTKRFDGLTIVTKGVDSSAIVDIDRVEDACNSAIWGLLKEGDTTDLFEDAQEIDMGQFDESERQFLIVDKDNKQIYDMRKARDMERLATQTDVGRSSRLTDNSLLNNLNTSLN